MKLDDLMKLGATESKSSPTAVDAKLSAILELKKLADELMREHLMGKSGPEVAAVVSADAPGMDGSGPDDEKAEGEEDLLADAPDAADEKVDAETDEDKLKNLLSK